jgi:hypothetical protein
MENFWFALGRGFIKLLVSLFAACGVGLLVFAIAAKDDPLFWQSRYPPAGLFFAIGSGLLTAAVLLVVFFLVPWWWRKPASTPEPTEGKQDVMDIRADPDPTADRPHEYRSSRFKAPPA